MGYLYLPFLFTSRRLKEQRSMGQIYFYTNEHACRELRWTKSAFGGEEEGKCVSKGSREEEEPAGD